MGIWAGGHIGRRAHRQVAHRQVADTKAGGHIGRWAHRRWALVRTISRLQVSMLAAGGMVCRHVHEVGVKKEASGHVITWPSEHVVKWTGGRMGS